MAQTDNATLISPLSLPREVGNAFSAMLRRGRLTQHGALDAIRQLPIMPIRLTEIDLEASMQLSGDLRIYAYDAYMLDCASRHRCALLTLDRGLRYAARQIGVPTVEVSG